LKQSSVVTRCQTSEPQPQADWVTTED
jgi:hypothetical protein